MTNAEVRAACLAVRAQFDLSHEQRNAVLSAALRAMRLAAGRTPGAR